MENDTRLDAILATVTTLANQFVRLDTNQTVLAAQNEAEEATSTAFRIEVRSSLNRLEAAVVELARDVKVVRERVEEVDDRHGHRLKVLEANGTNGHG